MCPVTHILRAFAHRYPVQPGTHLRSSRLLTARDMDGFYERCHRPRRRRRGHPPLLLPHASCASHLCLWRPIASCAASFDVTIADPAPGWARPAHSSHRRPSALMLKCPRDHPGRRPRTSRCIARSASARRVRRWTGEKTRVEFVDVGHDRNEFQGPRWLPAVSCSAALSAEYGVRSPSEVRSRSRPRRSVDWDEPSRGEPP
jgi:hypothetical protein